jgi:hypothetical protein
MKTGFAGRREAFVAMCVLAPFSSAFGSDTPARANHPALAATPPGPPVVCEPCAEVPPPRGYHCAGEITVRDDVSNDRVPCLQRWCAREIRKKLRTDKIAARR